MQKDTTWITVCDTCKTTQWQDGDPTTDGERLATLIEAAAKPHSNVKVRRHSCLMGCSRACNITIQAANKLSYTLCEFQPNQDDAEAVAAYAALHAESGMGQVPYRSWPEGVKGHFATRHPPLPEL